MGICICILMQFSVFGLIYGPFAKLYRFLYLSTLSLCKIHVRRRRALENLSKCTNHHHSSSSSSSVCNRRDFFEFLLLTLFLTLFIASTSSYSIYRINFASCEVKKSRRRRRSVLYHKHFALTSFFSFISLRVFDRPSKLVIYQPLHTHTVQLTKHICTSTRVLHI